MVSKEVTPIALAHKYLTGNVAIWFNLLLPLDTIYQNHIISGMKVNLKFQF